MNQTIGQVAERVGVSTETLRRWEAEGLIPPAQRQFINRWRVWSEQDIDAIERVVEDRSRASLCPCTRPSHERKRDGG